MALHQKPPRHLTVESCRRDLQRTTGRGSPLAGQPPSLGGPTHLGRAYRRNAMPEPTNKEIEARAYQLWEKAGQPEGQEDEFRHLAQQELRNEDKSSPTRTPDTL